MRVESVDDALVVELARDVVRQVAPQEMPLFRANSEAYLKDPAKALRGGRSGDQLLGFGAGIEITLLTPIALEVATQVIKLLAAEAAKAAGQESAPMLRELVRGMFTKFRPAGSSPPVLLTQAQLRQVHEVAYQAACRLQLPADQARLLADSTVGGLAVA